MNADVDRGIDDGSFVLVRLSDSKRAGPGMDEVGPTLVEEIIVPDSILVADDDIGHTPPFEELVSSQRSPAADDDGDDDIERANPADPDLDPTSLISSSTPLNPLSTTICGRVALPFPCIGSIATIPSSILKSLVEGFDNPRSGTGVRVVSLDSSSER